jgi:N-acylneuraminate cytidylyltransferase
VEVVGVVFARGGSKGILNKNLQSVAGESLLIRAICAGQQATLVDRVVVSTDSLQIGRVARGAGADVIMRPDHLAQDASPEWESWQYTLRVLRDQDGELPSAMVSIPTTAPLRDVADIDACIMEFHSGKWDTVVTVTEARRSPYFNMVRVDGSGKTTVAIPPQTNVSRRQDTPVLYDLCTVAYVADPQFVLQSSSIWEGRVGAVRVPQERSLDIDTRFDLMVADLVLRGVTGCS